MKPSIGYEIERLLSFAFRNGLIEEADIVPSRNALLDLFGLSEPADVLFTDSEHADSADHDHSVHNSATFSNSPASILENMLDVAATTGLLPDNNGTYRDLLDARIMGLLMPRASETNRKFWQLAKEQSVKSATDYFYKQSVASNYIRLERLAKNLYWLANTAFGELEITVNLSRPEKDPKEIALLKNAPSSNYPKCLLCEENVGYAGRLNHPARQNHRIIPLELCGEPWFFQYSPYVYYNEHSIVLHKEHIPMKISPATFRRLIEFVEQFPHYFIGSNADLPIVGGSILNHDHFQAGRHRFAMEKAPIEADFADASIPGVKAGIVVWPLSVIRLRSRDKEQLLAAADRIFALWRDYSDAAVGILSHTEQDGGVRIPHNTITPIARLNQSGELELDLVLRNNRTDAEHPDGIFHPNKKLHHIKQENIGLIEVMGLAVLPGRLKEEMAAIGRFLTGETPYDAAAVSAADHPLAKHAAWAAELVARFGTAMSAAETETLLQAEVGRKFMEVLTDCGVYKRDSSGQAGFRRFLSAAGFTPAEA